MIVRKIKTGDRIIWKKKENTNRMSNFVIGFISGIECTVMVIAIHLI